MPRAQSLCRHAGMHTHTGEKYTRAAHAQSPLRAHQRRPDRGSAKSTSTVMLDRHSFGLHP